MQCGSFKAVTVEVLGMLMATQPVSCRITWFMQCSYNYKSAGIINNEKFVHLTLTNGNAGYRGYSWGAILDGNYYQWEYSNGRRAMLGSRSLQICTLLPVYKLLIRLPQRLTCHKVVNLIMKGENVRIQVYAIQTQIWGLCFGYSFLNKIIICALSFICFVGFCLKDSFSSPIFWYSTEAGLISLPWIFMRIFYWCGLQTLLKIFLSKLNLIFDHIRLLWFPVGSELYI